MNDDFAKACAYWKHDEGSLREYFYVLLEEGEHNASVDVFNVTEWTADDKGCDHPSAWERVATLHQKWDGCCNFNIENDDGHMLHTCSRLDFECLMDAIKFGREVACKHITAYGPRLGGFYPWCERTV